MMSDLFWESHINGTILPFSFFFLNSFEVKKVLFLACNQLFLSSDSRVFFMKSLMVTPQRASKTEKVEG